MRILIAFIFCAFSAHILVAQTVQPATTPLSCACGGSSTTANLTSSELQARRGIPAFIVLRGQRFGGKFGERIGAGTDAVSGGFPLPLFPERLGSRALGGGVSVTTANHYGLSIGPFKAGLPTSATIIAEIVDIFGDVVQNESGTLAVLVLGAVDSSQAGNFFETRPVYFPGGKAQYSYLPSVQVISRQRLQTRSQNGRFEWEGVNIGGVIGTTLTLTVQHPSLPMCGCAVQIALQGGYPDNCIFARLNIPTQPAAVPGYLNGQVGASPYIVINETVSFAALNNDFKNITVAIRDRFNNPASFPTTATLNVGVNKTKSVVLGDIAGSRLEWGIGKNDNEMRHIATFPNFKVIGATANNVSLVVSIPPDPTLEAVRIGSDFLSTSSTVNIFPAPAIGLTPVTSPDIYNRNLPNRISSKFYTRRSNRGDPRTWFYVQAVDEYGNRADGGPNAYNGGIATITFQSPELGLPRASGFAANSFYTPRGFQFSAANDPHVKVNTQRYNAKGTSAVAVNGLYTFNDFIPLGPPSIDPLGNDVVLTFEDPSLPGVIPCTSCVGTSSRPLYPPITTATTTFIETPLVSLIIPERGQEGAATNGSVRLADNALLLREKSPTLFYERDRLLETGSVRVERAITAASNDVAVGYTLRYVSLDSNARAVPPIPSFAATSRTFDLPNDGTGRALQLPVPINTMPPPFFFIPPPLPMAVQINGLNGDLSPIIPAGNRPERNASVSPIYGVGTFFLDAGTTHERVNFTARWSDQVWYRTPARQGLRTAILRILDPDVQNSTIYEVDKTSGKDSAFVFLLDPREIAPVIMNAIQDKAILRPQGNTTIEDRVELEAPVWRDGNIPGFVLYDDNYDPITYSAVSEDPSQVAVRIIQPDERFQGRPSLYYTVQPGARSGAMVRITLRGFDGTIDPSGARRVATDEFFVNVVPSITDASSTPTIMSPTIFPNPAGASNDEAFVQFGLQEISHVRIELISMQGVSVIKIDTGLMPSGDHRYRLPLGNLPSGVYGVRLTAGDRVQTAMMTVMR